MSEDHIPFGKLPNPVLAELLGKLEIRDPRVVVGPGVGLDAAVLDIGERYLVAKTDPITFATEQLGWYGVHVNANDLACMAASPRWYLATLLLPSGASKALAEQVFDQIRAACDSLGVALVGGHTEITHGIDRPILVGCLLGEVEKDSLITAAGAQPGDAVLLSGGVPIEAVAILAHERADQLADRFDADYLERCRQFLVEPGISVVGAARAAAATGAVHAMHDPTEGGLATGLWELAMASRHALEVEEHAIPILPEGRALCAAFDLDPLASIASGALLLAVPSGRAPEVQAALAGEGITCSRIGVIVQADEPAVWLVDDGARRPLPLPARDEIATLFDG